MPYRIPETYRHFNADALKDWAAFGLTGPAAIGITLAQINAALTAISLVIAIAIGFLRLRAHWRHRNDPPGS